MIFTDFEQQKQALRCDMLRQRSQIEQHQRKKAASLIISTLLRLPVIHKAKHIATYYSVKHEIKTHLINRHLWQMSKQLYLPKVNHKNCSVLSFAPYNANTPLKQNCFNISEPEDCIDITVKQPLDIILIPLVAFNSQGRRLGMGGGFYDKTIYHIQQKITSNSSPYLIGLAYDCQYHEAIPKAWWDLKLCAIATPSKLFYVH